MAMSVPKVMSDNQPKIQKAQRTSGNRNAKKIILSHIIFKLQKITGKKKNKTEKSQRGKKQLTYKGTKIKTTFKFSSETMHAGESAVNKMFREKTSDVEFCTL